MPVSPTPGPRRKGRAGLVIAVIVVLVAIAVFVGMNIDHAKEAAETPGGGPPNTGATLSGAPPQGTNGTNN